MAMVGSVVILAITVSAVLGAGTPGCTHPVFCNETILAAVADSVLFPDSKSFVDSMLTVDIDQALRIFDTRPFSQFISRCLTSNSSVLQPANLTDWVPIPGSLSHVTNPELQAYALDLNRRWIELAKKVDLSYRGGCRSRCTTFLGEVDGRVVVVPGGRFSESYYWDSYWIIKGLIACDMVDTATELVLNFVAVLEKHGFIPNGFRDYFMNRSQPPFFGLMAKEVVEALRLKGMAAKADKLEQKVLPVLMTENQFFMKTHSLTYTLKSGAEIRLNYYNANTTSPRPESYREDLKLVQGIVNSTQRARILKGVSSMAESGWDFSSRWLTNAADLRTNIIEVLIPSDLNTLMALSQAYLVSLCRKYNRTEAQVYLRQYQHRLDYFQEVYNGRYFPDYSFGKKRPQNQVFPSDFYPFLLKKHQPTLPGLYNDTVNPVSSQTNSGQQWDMPNVWAPNNWILHEILPLRQGFRFAREWVQTTYCSWKREGAIYEKYRSDRLGQRGQGGEYTVQTGFGWTNGLALYYLRLYGNQIGVPVCP